MPLVSIIVRTKDRPKLLKKALESISAQTYRPIEVALVNDGGCELDVEELEGVLGGIPLNYMRLEKNTGRAHAGNVGIENAKGEYVGFLDDDDEFCPEHVSVLAACLQEMDCRVAYTDSEIVFRSYTMETMDVTETDRYIFFSKDFSLRDLLIENYIPLITLLFHKDVFAAEKGFDEGFEAYEDWDLLIRCGLNYPFHHIKTVTAKYVQWSRELQIAQSSEYSRLLESSYDKVIRKHADKYTPDLVRYCRDSLSGLNTAIKERESALSEKERKLVRLENTLGERDAYIEYLLADIKNLEDAVSEKEAFIRLLQSGRGWRLLTKYYRLRDRFLNVLH